MNRVLIFFFFFSSFMVSFHYRPSWAGRSNTCCVRTLCWTHSSQLTLEGQASTTPSSLHLSGSSCRFFCQYHHVKATRLPSVCSPTHFEFLQKTALFFIYSSLVVLKLANTRTYTSSHPTTLCYAAQKGSLRLTWLVSEEGNKPQGPPSDLLAVTAGKNACTWETPRWGLSAMPGPSGHALPGCSWHWGPTQGCNSKRSTFAWRTTTVQPRHFAVGSVFIHLGFGSQISTEMERAFLAAP